MKPSVIVSVALALGAGSLSAFAQGSGIDPDRHIPQANNYGGYYRGDNYDARQRREYFGARGPEFRRGGYIPREFYNRQYYVNDWRAHHLYAPQRGQQWVQVGGDYVLIALATGLIANLVLMQ